MNGITLPLRPNIKKRTQSAECTVETKSVELTHPTALHYILTSISQAIKKRICNNTQASGEDNSPSDNLDEPPSSITNAMTRRGDVHSKWHICVQLSIHERHTLQQTRAQFAFKSKAKTCSYIFAC